MPSQNEVIVHCSQSTSRLLFLLRHFGVNVLTRANHKATEARLLIFEGTGVHHFECLSNQELDLLILRHPLLLKIKELSIARVPRLVNIIKVLV